ncbi:hypothetical protein DFJ58DRAFT_58394 [Suillus subalutaceus]|uniref:uncharacterized protein n=1 Tax=Suillus subalutaceus TaxID=48586 RepID=UPI001B8604AA|nr:uncharacterized protein DFJ58DRAFT_58394 [Suillus subalutaceus]KAG1842262.1 hypothetical protein DFJ58DRAFT_58394 [Suillus subalutaceus]
MLECFLELVVLQSVLILLVSRLPMLFVWHALSCCHVNRVLLWLLLRADDRGDYRLFSSPIYANSCTYHLGRFECSSFCSRDQRPISRSFRFPCYILGLTPTPLPRYGPKLRRIRVPVRL